MNQQKRVTFKVCPCRGLRSCPTITIDYRHKVIYIADDFGQQVTLTFEEAKLLTQLLPSKLQEEVK